MENQEDIGLDRKRISQCLQQMVAAEQVLATARETLAEVCHIKPIRSIGSLEQFPEAREFFETRSGGASEDAVRIEKSETTVNYAHIAQAAKETKKKVNNMDENNMVENTADMRLILDQALMDSLAADDKRSSKKKTVTFPVGANVGRVNTAEFDDMPMPSNWSVLWTPCCCGGRVRFPVFNPESHYMILWNVIGFVFLVYLGFAIPVYIAFDVVPTGLFFMLASITDTYFIMDVILNFMIAARDSSGVFIVSRVKIAKLYATSWLVADFIASIPWDWIPVDAKMAQISKGVRFLRITRIARFSRLIKLMTGSALKEKLDILIESSPQLVFLVGIIRILMLLFVIMHWAACVWYIVGTLDPDGPSWVNAHLNGNHDTVQRYFYALYFTLTTMTTVGYGDIVALNFSEVCFVLVLLLIASFVFAGLMGSPTDLISNLNTGKNQMAEKKRMLSQYMHWRAVPHGLFTVLRQHLLFLWEAHAGYDTYEEEVKGQLPPVLRKELCYHIYGKILCSVPFLAWMRTYKSCLKELADMLSSIFLSNGDYMFRVGDPDDKAYVMVNGVARLSLNEDLCGTSITSEDDDDEPFFGLQIQGLQLRQPSVLSSSKDTNGLDAERLPSQPMFTTGIIDQASSQIEQQDAILTKAAIGIQRAVRRRHRKGRHTEVKRGSVSVIRTKSVHAPAFFGEACFWVPYDEWQTNSLSFKYSARCESRAEIVLIAREVVWVIIQRYSPYLKDRFESFQRAVLSGARRSRTEDQVLRTPAYADLPATRNSNQPVIRRATVSSPPVVGGVGLQEPLLQNV